MFVKYHISLTFLAALLSFAAVAQPRRFAALATKANELDSLAVSDKAIRRFTFNEPVIFSEFWDTTKVHVTDMDWSTRSDTLWLCATDFKHRHYKTPVKGEVVSVYGWRRRRMHHGIDLRLTTGDTVYASFDGKVRYSDYNYGGYGNLIVLRHFSGLETYYGHLSALFVDPNSFVKAGDPIGLGGNTGRSTGPHLHFEVRYMGSSLNPEYLIDFRTGALRDPNVLVYKGKWAYPRPMRTAMKQEDTHLHDEAPAPSAVYRVKQGDTLYSIAKRNGTTVQNLCRINGINERRPIFAGQRLRLK